MRHQKRCGWKKKERVHKGSVLNWWCVRSVSFGHVNYCILKSTLTRSLLLKYCKEKKTKNKVCDIVLKSRRGHSLGSSLSVFLCFFLLQFNKSGTWPAPAPPPKIKNIKTLKEEIWNLKKLSAILYYGGEVDMSAQWDPTSNKDQHFFHCFSFWWWRWCWWWAWFKDQKSKIASKFWYIYGSVTFFCLSFFFFPLRPFCFSGRVCTDRDGRHHLPVYPSIRLSVHPCVWTCCVGCLLSVPVSCFLLPVCLSVCRWAGP